jgi:hypothetical protein
MSRQQKEIYNFQLLKEINAPTNRKLFICLPTLIINAQNNNNILITYLPTPHITN